MQNNKLIYIMWAATLVLVAALTFFIVLHFNKSEPQVIEKPVLVPGKDSIIVMHYNHYYNNTTPGTIVNDTAKTQINDLTIFGKDSLTSKIDIAYSFDDSSFAVARSYDLKHSETSRVDTLKMYYETTKEVEKEVPFYKDPYFNYGLGLVTALLILIFG